VIVSILRKKRTANEMFSLSDAKILFFNLFVNQASKN
jgi:hypothetical protein